MRKMKTAAVLLSLAIAAICVPVQTAPVHAQRPVIDVTPIYDDFAYACHDALYLWLPSQCLAHVELIQHSPERDRLVVYQDDLYPETDVNYRYLLEPGSYTMEVSIPAAEESLTAKTAIYPFTVENADYAADFDETSIYFNADLMLSTDDGPLTPELTQDETQILGGLKLTVSEVLFFRYAHSLGDFDGDGRVTADDAQKVLNVYTAELAQNPPEQPLTPAQKLLADIDGDSALTASDAQYILNYYTATLAQMNPSWTELRHPNMDKP